MQESKIQFVTSDSSKSAVLWAQLLAFFDKNQRLIVIDRNLNWFDNRGRMEMDAILTSSTPSICCIQGDFAPQLQQWWREINLQQWQHGQISWWHLIPPELERWQKWKNWAQEWHYFPCFCLGDLDRGSAQQWRSMPQIPYFPKLWLPERDWQAWSDYNGDFTAAIGRYSLISAQSRQRIINWLQEVFRLIELTSNISQNNNSLIEF